MSGTTGKPVSDAMVCRACGREERASEGYPCEKCGTFICLICMFQGVILCKACQGDATPPNPGVGG